MSYDASSSEKHDDQHSNDDGDDELASVDEFEHRLDKLSSRGLRINDFNVHKLVNTCEVLKGRLNSIEERCVEHLRDRVQENFFIANALEMLLSALVDVESELTNLLIKYLMKHIDYYSESSKFLGISYSNLSVILKRGRSDCENRNALLEGVIRWVHHSRDERRKYFRELIAMIDLSKVSPSFFAFVLAKYECFIDRVQDSPKAAPGDRRSSSKLKDEHSNAANEEWLHLYVKYPDEGMTNVLARNADVWWSKLAELWYDTTHMRNVALGSQLYRLDHRPQTPWQSKLHHQKFSLSSSTQVICDSYLNHPPVILQHFEMCGLPNNCTIFLYDSNVLGSSHHFINESIPCKFSEEMLSRGIFAYNCELDKWFSLPALNYLKMNRACVTADHNLLYVLGGENCDRVQGTCAQAYDQRIEKWIRLSSPSNAYKDAVCCMHQEKVYVLSKYSNEMEVYDPSAGKWQNVHLSLNINTLNHRIVSYRNRLSIIAQNENDQNSYIELRSDDYAQNWFILCKYVMDLNLAQKLQIQDVVVFKCE